MAVSDALRKLFGGGKNAKSVYQRGMKKANRRDLPGAIADYTLVVDMPHADGEIRAMAMFNRALAHAASENHDAAEADLQALLKNDRCPARVASAAKEKLKRIERKRSR